VIWFAAVGCRSRIGTTVSVAAVLCLLGGSASVASEPSRSVAARYAHRTYIVQAVLGKRRFKLIGPRAVVSAADRSTITAFAIVLDSADGTGQAVLLFRNRRFLGWASAFDSLRLSLSRSAEAIVVRYGTFRGTDPFCCPSGVKVVRYRWNGRSVVADGTPPTAYGRRLERLHLAAR
jgi:hypothetical protein